jgi:putative RNA 2'-phosphotransferase
MRFAAARTSDSILTLFDMDRPDKHLKRISKLLSLVLRHKPQRLNLRLDKNGWMEVDMLLQAINRSGLSVDMELLDKVVAENDKQRFAFNEDKSKIRANQGHSVDVDVELKPAAPPKYLYHGTVAKFLDAIRETGLKKMSRQHVHLSATPETATKVGSRRGKPFILTIDAEQMAKDGYVFYLSTNGVWLTDEVPVRYIAFQFLVH